MASFVPQLGSRVAVQCNGTYITGTVRYSGSTSFKPGVWVGVELDLNEGKNDGSVQGVKYFECEDQRGLFVRPGALRLLDDDVKQHKIASAIPRDEKGEEDDDAHISLFTMHTRVFVFDKPNQQWIEKGSGDTFFKWITSIGKFWLQLGQSSHVLDHLVEPSTKVEDSVATQQSWVFRAVRRSNNTKQVLCLQFGTVHEARVFVSTFEGCRASMLKVAQTHDEESKDNGLHIQTVDDQEEEEGGEAAPKQRKTRVMRRRLTVSGSDPHLDGHRSGAHLEPKSPQPASPKVFKPGSETCASPKSSKRQSTTKNNHGSAGIVVAYSGVSRKGVAPYNPDKQNQDSMIMQQLPNTGNCNGELLLAVFDGHGENGHTVSRYFETRIPQLLTKAKNFENDAVVGRILSDALLVTENELINDYSVDVTLSGTTAVVTLLRGNKLFIANVGDSRIVLARDSDDPKSKNRLVAHDLSQDHKPDLAKEKARIEKIGGRVFAMKYDDGVDGPARVWLSYADMPGLAMSRSLCDTVGKEAGVISQADMFTRQISKSDRFIVLATDGLWEFMSSQEVVDIVAKYMEPNPDPRSAISELIKESNKRWKREEPVIDDTTIVVAYFKE